MLEKRSEIIIDDKKYSLENLTNASQGSITSIDDCTDGIDSGSTNECNATSISLVFTSINNAEIVIWILQTKKVSDDCDSLY